MKKSVIFILITQLFISTLAFSKMPAIDMNKRAKCKIPITNIVRPYQEMNDYYYRFLYTFEEQRASRFVSDKLFIDTNLYCVSLDRNKKSFYPKVNGKRILVNGRWGYHLYKDGTFTEVVMVLGEEKDFQGICGDDHTPYSATSSGVYSLVFYRSIPGSELLERVTTDQQLEQTNYYADLLRSMDEVSNAAAFLANVSITIMVESFKTIFVPFYIINFISYGK